MTTDLKLRREDFEDGSFLISWVDTVSPKFTGGGGQFIPIAVLALAGGLIIAVVMETLAPLIIGLLIAGGLLVLSRRNQEVPNAVGFSRDVITHKLQEFPTADITRFEYGLRSAMTGQEPNKHEPSGKSTDPMVIRMWINDAHAHQISINNWQNQVNHQIRDTLAKALDRVRKDSAKTHNIEKYGEKGEFGVPDY